MLFTIGTFVSGAISWKCFVSFDWNLVWVYIWIRRWCTPNGIVHHLLITELWPFVSSKNDFYYRHFCVRSHIFEVLWQISLKLGMKIYMDKMMMHAKWHCTTSVNNGVIALCTWKNAFYYRHFCVRSHILEVLWRISLKLGMSIYMDKRMHAKWHCTPSVNNGVMALCILKKCFLL